MRAGTAIKKENSAKKISTVETTTGSFDRELLVTELLSLGHRQISPALARSLSKEVEAELRRRPATLISAEVISELVQFKLEELGILEIRRRKPSQSKIDFSNSPILEPESSLGEMTSNLSRFNLRSIDPQLPTLERFIRHGASPKQESKDEPKEDFKTTSGPSELQVEETNKPSARNDIIIESHCAAEEVTHCDDSINSAPIPTMDSIKIPIEPPLPPKAELRLSAASLNWIRQNLFPGQEETAVLQAYEALLNNIANQAAGLGKQAGNPASIMAVEFFNCMANQEFFPQIPALLGSSKPITAGDVYLWVAISAKAWKSALDEAESLWKSGKSIGFLLEEDSHQSWNPAEFEKMLQTLERVLLDLPERVSKIPPPLFQISITHPYASEFLEVAYSDRFYLRFQFQWTVPAENDLSDVKLQEILKNTWKKSEPRLVFLDQEDGFSLSGAKEPAGPIPQGGLVLNSGEVCALGSLNLSIFSAGTEIDWVKLRRVVHTAVHFLESQLQQSNFPSDQTRQLLQRQRKIGLGVMGYADLLAKLGIPYTSEAALHLAEKLMRFIAQESRHQMQSGKENASSSTSSPLISYTTIHPSQNLARLADVNPGIEPFSELIQDGNILPLLKQIGKSRKAWSDHLESELLSKENLAQCDLVPKSFRSLFLTVKEIPAEWVYRMYGAFQKNCDGLVEISLPFPLEVENQWLESILRCRELGIRLLKGEAPPLFQDDLVEKELEMSPSNEDILNEEIKAVVPEPENPPLTEPAESISFEEISAALHQSMIQEMAIVQAMHQEIHSVSEPNALTHPFSETKLSSSDEQFEEEEEEEEEITTPAFPIPIPRPRAEVLSATIRQIQTGCGTMTIALAQDEYGPFELRAQLGKSGSCANAQAEAISRLTSLLFERGIEAKQIHHELSGIRCPHSALDHGERVLSCADGIAKALARQLNLTNSADDAEKKSFENPVDTEADEEEITIVT